MTDTELKPVLPQRVRIQEPFQPILQKALTGRWAETPIDSPASALSSPARVPLHLGDRLLGDPGAELANRKVRSTRHPASRLRGPRSNPLTPARASPLPTPRFLRRGSSAPQNAAQPAGQRFPLLFPLPGFSARFPHLLPGRGSPNASTSGRPGLLETPFLLAT